MSAQITVDIYCRIALISINSVAQLDLQEAVCRQYCLEHGLVVGAVHREVFSATQYRERVGLTAMRQRYKQGATQGVVVTNLDRLSHSHVHLLILLYEMERHHITVYVAKEDVDKTALGRLMRMMVAFAVEVAHEKALEHNDASSSQL